MLLSVSLFTRLFVLAVISLVHYLFFRTYLPFVAVYSLPLCHVSLSLYVNPQLLSISTKCVFIMRLPDLTSVYKHLSCGSRKLRGSDLCRGTTREQSHLFPYKDFCAPVWFYLKEDMKQSDTNIQ